MLTRLYGRIAAGKTEDGTTAVEYAFMIGLVALVIVLAVTALGGRVAALFSQAATAF